MDLRGVLYDAAVKAGAEVRLGSLVSSIDMTSRTVILSSGDSLVADVIVGADGSYGMCRKLVAGGENKGSPSGYVLYQ
jgi:salicylate hydroxylase